MHSKIGAEHPYEANRIVELVGRMFELAHTWGLVPENHKNPAKGIEHFREKKRDRWVNEEELPLLAQAIDREQNIHARYCLWLYLLTGARKAELLKAKWVDVDLHRKELKLPETKSGRIHYVPLSPAALTVLEKIPRANGNPHIFVGRIEGAHLVNIHKPWQRVRQAAGIEDVRLHESAPHRGQLAGSGGKLIASDRARAQSLLPSDYLNIRAIRRGSGPRRTRPARRAHHGRHRQAPPPAEVLGFKK